MSWQGAPPTQDAYDRGGAGQGDAQGGHKAGILSRHASKVARRRRDGDRRMALDVQFDSTTDDRLPDKCCAGRWLRPRSSWSHSVAGSATGYVVSERHIPIAIAIGQGHRPIAACVDDRITNYGLTIEPTGI